MAAACRILGLGLAEFPISHAAKSFYDFGPRRWLLIRDNELTFEAFVKVVILGLALRNHGEPKIKGKQDARFKIVSRFG